MSAWGEFLGTVLAKFQIGLGGVKLNNDSGGLKVQNTSDVDSPITGSQLNASGNEIDINSDAAETGADWKLKLIRPAAGMTADLSLTFPVSAGSPSQVLQTDGSGILSWLTPATGTQYISNDATNLAFGTASPVTMFSLPVGAVVQEVRVIIDTAFDGTPSLSIGIVGTTAKYMPATSIDLKAIAKTTFIGYPAEAAIVGSPEAMIATYAAGGASVGAARIEVDYCIPS